MTDYCVFSDESRYNAARFRAIAAVSLADSNVNEVGGVIVDALRSSDVAEFKWQDLTSAKARFCADKLLDVVFGPLLSLGGRVDVLIWDTHDDRHRIVGRDDRANWERMFFHLHDHVMKRREHASSFHLFPDERCDTDWVTLADCLAARGRWRGKEALFGDAPNWRYAVRTLKPTDSAATPICQLADLFAGMAPYTRSTASMMKQLLEGEQGTLFNDAQRLTPSTSDAERFPVIRDLAARCASRGLGLSFKTDGYLRTHGPSSPINFWHYTPQHENDRSPVVAARSHALFDGTRR